MQERCNSTANALELQPTDMMIHFHVDILLYFFLFLPLAVTFDIITIIIIYDGDNAM